ncbi:CvpA family protein [Thomasclavelia cocleata]|uniref:CvpA family protein n=1 Tax=Thomasclavelia cocleata TaxID=69824 RepID=UPI002432ADFC|nr:CvpA family protein [Thomasclavelia cocleata]
MNFVINSLFIDIVITFILLLMLIFGYFKGFVYRAYDLVATIISLLAALYGSSPLSNLYTIYEVTGLGEAVGKVVNRFIIFIILFIGLKVVLLLIGKIIKPLLKKVIYSFKLFEQLDRLLGIVASFFEGVIMIYLALIFIIMPIVPGGKENVEKTVVAKKILELVPTVTNEIESLDVISEVINDGINYDSFDADSIYTITVSLNNAYDKGLLSQEDLENSLLKYYRDIDNIETPIILNKSQYDEVEKLLLKIDRSKIDIDKILNKIIVSE